MPGYPLFTFGTRCNQTSHERCWDQSGASEATPWLFRGRDKTQPKPYHDVATLSHAHQENPKHARKPEEVNATFMVRAAIVKKTCDCSWTLIYLDKCHGSQATDDVCWRTCCTAKIQSEVYKPLPKEVYGNLAANTSWAATGESLGELIDRSLRVAWGSKPPRIDAVLRSGCGGASELQVLYPSLELFWPSFLGDVILVFDAGEEKTPELMLPQAIQKSRLSWRVVYEHVPCGIPGRLFNQVSYLHFDRLTTADYIVTFDSDCVLHSPVTPDLLFDSNGKLMLAFTNKFQKTNWATQVDFFTGVGTSHAHTMVTQPVPFLRATLPAYREWLNETAAKRSEYGMKMGWRNPNASGCLADETARFRTLLTWRNMWKRYCWMCQLGTFLEITGRTRGAYNLVYLERTTNTRHSNASAPYQRMAMHVTYEYGTTAGLGYLHDALLIVHEGLCRALGNKTVPTCAGVGRSFVDNISFGYGGRIPCAAPLEPEMSLAALSLTSGTTKSRPPLLESVQVSVASQHARAWAADRLRK